MISKAWIQTFTGKVFELFDPKPDQIDIRDIAHALALTVRFNGHSIVPYSVAQHSVLVASAVPAEMFLEALLHDASEAYVGDMVRPLKQTMHMYRDVEDKIQMAILRRFDVEEAGLFGRSWKIKNADMRALVTERRDLMAPGPAWTNPPPEEHEPFPDKIVPWGWEMAEHRFLTEFNARYRGKP